MLVKSPLGWSRNGCVSSAVCAIFLLGVGLAGSPAEAQSDPAAMAPWQAPHNSWSESQPSSQAYYSRGPSVARPGDSVEMAEFQGEFPGDAGPCGMGDGPCNIGCDSCREPSCFLQPCDRFWFRSEYLMWWGKSVDLPPLATTSPLGTLQDQAGVLGQPGTSVLFGGGNGDLGLRSGGRFTLGGWLDPCKDVGFEATYLFLGNHAVHYNQSSQGEMILARPFRNAVSGLEDAALIAFPNVQTGSINIRAGSELESVDLLFRKTVFQQCNRRLQFLYGYRYGRLAEDIAIDESSTYTSQVGTIPVGTVMQTSDLFDVRNEFHGAEIGFSTEVRYCRWTLGLLAKLALGSTRSRATIDGSTVVAVPGQPSVTYDGGLLALPTNMGHYQQNNFSVMPELGVTLGYDLTPRLKATFGYTFLYWSQVARPADQIDLDINTSQFPPGDLSGIASPEMSFVTGDFWAQGLSFGLDYRF